MTETDLWRYREEKKACRAAQDRLDEYEARIYHPATQRLGEVDHGSGGGDALAKIAATHTKLQQEYTSALSRAQQAYSLLLLVRGLLEEETERQFLQARYMLGKSWEATARELHYSKKSISRIRVEILKKIARF